jgi:hypothetical protein
MANIFSRTVPEPGTQTNIYTHTPLNVGQTITVEHPTGQATATVTHDYGAAGGHVSNVHDNSQPSNQRSENLGSGYYQIEID